MLRLCIAIAWLFAGLGAMALFGHAGAWAYPIGRDTVWSVSFAGMALWAAIEVPALKTAFMGLRNDRT
jgi:hypothetical protein